MNKMQKEKAATKIQNWYRNTQILNDLFLSSPFNLYVFRFWLLSKLPDNADINNKIKLFLAQYLIQNVSSYMPDTASTESQPFDIKTAISLLKKYYRQSSPWFEFHTGYYARSVLSTYNFPINKSNHKILPCLSTPPKLLMDHAMTCLGFKYAGNLMFDIPSLTPLIKKLYHIETKKNHTALSPKTVHTNAIPICNGLAYSYPQLLEIILSHDVSFQQLKQQVKYKLKPLWDKCDQFNQLLNKKITSLVALRHSKAFFSLMKKNNDNSQLGIISQIITKMINHLTPQQIQTESSYQLIHLYIQQLLAHHKNSYFCAMLYDLIQEELRLLVYIQQPYAKIDFDTQMHHYFGQAFNNSEPYQFFLVPGGGMRAFSLALFECIKIIEEFILGEYIDIFIDEKCYFELKTITQCINDATFCTIETFTSKKIKNNVEITPYPDPNYDSNIRLPQNTPQYLILAISFNDNININDQLADNIHSFQNNDLNEYIEIIINSYGYNRIFIIIDITIVPDLKNIPKFLSTQKDRIKNGTIIPVFISSFQKHYTLGVDKVKAGFICTQKNIHLKRLNYTPNLCEYDQVSNIDRQFLQHMLASTPLMFAQISQRVQKNAEFLSEFLFQEKISKNSQLFSYINLDNIYNPAQQQALRIAKKSFMVRNSFGFVHPSSSEIAITSRIYPGLMGKNELIEIFYNCTQQPQTGELFKTTYFNIFTNTFRYFRQFKRPRTLIGNNATIDKNISSYGIYYHLIQNKTCISSLIIGAEEVISPFMKLRQLNLLETPNTENIQTNWILPSIKNLPIKIETIGQLQKNNINQEYAKKIISIILFLSKKMAQLDYFSLFEEVIISLAVQIRNNYRKYLSPDSWKVINWVYKLSLLFNYHDKIINIKKDSQSPIYFIYIKRQYERKVMVDINLLIKLTYLLTKQEETESELLHDLHYHIQNHPSTNKGKFQLISYFIKLFDITN